MCQEMARLHIFAPFNPELLGALSSKNFSKKTLLFEAEISVPRYAQNAGFCTIYPRASGLDWTTKQFFGQPKF
jgi:hypothetical protein